MPELICQLFTGVIFITMAVSISSLTAIAFVRWYVITKSIRGHRGLHTPRRVAILVVIIWTMSIILLGVPILLGVGEVGYDSYFLICNATNPGILVVSSQVGFIVINLILTGIFYAKILRFVLRHNRLFRTKYLAHSIELKRVSHAKPSNCGNTNEVIMRREIEITKNLFLVFCIFVLCWLPNCINYSIPGKRALYLYFQMISYGNSIVNPIIYGLRHPNFRKVLESCSLLSHSSCRSRSVKVNI